MFSSASCHIRALTCSPAESGLSILGQKAVRQKRQSNNTSTRLQREHFTSTGADVALKAAPGCLFVFSFINDRLKPSLPAQCPPFKCGKINEFGATHKQIHRALLQDKSSESRALGFALQGENAVLLSEWIWCSFCYVLRKETAQGWLSEKAALVCLIKLKCAGQEAFFI